MPGSMKRRESRKGRSSRKDKDKERGGMNKYQVMGVVGEGAYGVVMKCRHKKTGEFVAMKKFKETGETDEAVRKTILREVKVLKLMRHVAPVVQLLESFRRKGRLYLVFEYIERNLLEVIEAHPDGCPMSLVERFMYQLCGAIAECHRMQILHRDIKPENLLVNDRNVLKLCDFGFARQVENYGDHLTDYVATRWYRAPELLVGDDTYGPAVDMWAAACIMGELADGDPLFPGDSEIDQLYVIQKLLGPITKPHMRTFLDNPRFMGLQFPDMSRPDRLPSRYSNVMSGKQLRFMSGVLTMEPAARLTAEDCLDHSIFDNVRNLYPEIKARREEVLGGGDADTAAVATATTSSSSLGRHSHSHGSHGSHGNAHGHSSSSHSTSGNGHTRKLSESKADSRASLNLASTGVNLLTGKPAPLVVHGGHKKNESFDSAQFGGKHSSLLPDCRPAKDGHVAAESHRRTQSEQLGVPTGHHPHHKQVASFSSLNHHHHPGLHGGGAGGAGGDVHFGSSNTSSFPGIADEFPPTGTVAASRSLSLPGAGPHGGGAVQRLHSPAMGHKRTVSSDFSVDSIHHQGIVEGGSGSGVGNPGHGGEYDYYSKTSSFSFGVM